MVLCGSGFTDMESDIFIYRIIEIDWFMKQNEQKVVFPSETPFISLHTLLRCIYWRHFLLTKTTLHCIVYVENCMIA